MSSSIKGGDAPGVDIWSKLIDEQRTASQAEEAYHTCGSPSILFMGESQSGKSTLVQSFLNKLSSQNSTHPTIGLDYRFARIAAPISCDSTNENSGAKIVCDIWEVGGGRSFVDCVHGPLKSGGSNMLCVIVVNLEHPQTLLSELAFWRKQLPSRNERGPLLIIANKFDKFKNNEPEELKVVGKFLRLIAMDEGASLLYSGLGSNCSKSHMLMRTMLTKHIMGKLKDSKSEMTQLDPLQTIWVPAGNDSIQQIGDGAEAAFRRLYPKSREFEMQTEEHFKSLINSQSFDSEPVVDTALAAKKIKSVI